METQGENLTYEQIKFRERVVAKLRSCAIGSRRTTNDIISNQGKDDDSFISSDYFDEDDSIELEKLIQKIYTSYELCEMIDVVLRLGWGDGVYCANNEKFRLWDKMIWLRGEHTVNTYHTY